MFESDKKAMSRGHRVAFVTGGSRGLGAALCEQLLAAGYELVEFSRSAPHAWSVPADLSQPDNFRTVVAQTLAPHAARAPAEVLWLHNAATLCPIGPVADKDPAVLVANLNTNVVSAVLGIAEFTRAFQALPGRKRVANVSSGAARYALAGWSLYCAAKAGMEAFIAAYALEQAGQPHPIVAVNLNPGVMDTAMQAEIRASDTNDFPDVARFVQRHAEGQLRPPAAVATALLKVLAAPTLISGATIDPFA